MDGSVSPDPPRTRPQVVATTSIFPPSGATLRRDYPYAVSYASPQETVVPLNHQPNPQTAIRRNRQKRKDTRDREDALGSRLETDAPQLVLSGYTTRMVTNNRKFLKQIQDLEDGHSVTKAQLDPGTLAVSLLDRLAP